MRAVGERRAENVSDRYELYARCREKRKGFGNDPMGSLDLSEQDRFFGRVLNYVTVMTLDHATNIGAPFKIFNFVLAANIPK